MTITVEVKCESKELAELTLSDIGEMIKEGWTERKGYSSNEHIGVIEYKFEVKNDQLSS